MTTTTSRIQHVLIGDGTPFEFNHWNGAVTNDGVHVAVVRGVKPNPGQADIAFAFPADALWVAKHLLAEAMEDEVVFVVTLQVFPEFDTEDDDTTLLYHYVVGPTDADAFEV